MAYEQEKKPIVIPIPGMQGQVGLGTLIKKATSAVGIKPCGGCQKRADQLGSSSGNYSK
jgi:hypothetical protein